MKKLLTILILLFSVKAFSQSTYVPINSYYKLKGASFDSVLHIPTGCGYPSLLTTKSWKGGAALYGDTCNNKLYFYRDTAWVFIPDSSYVATASAKRFGVSGEDETAGQNRTYNTNGFYLNIKGDGASSTAIGDNADAVGDSSVAIGRNSYATSNNSVSIGARAGILSSQSGVFIGLKAGESNTGSSVVAIGSNAGNGNTGNTSTLIGVAAGITNSGASTTAVGHQAGRLNTGGSLNAFGKDAGNTNTGNEVIAIGNTSARTNAGNQVMFIGIGAGDANTGDSLVMIGYGAGHNNTGKFIASLGRYSGDGNTGHSNTFLGDSVGVNNTYNSIILLGRNARANSSNQFAISDSITSIKGTNVNSVGFGTASPAASSVLDLTSTTKGFLPPRMTAAQRLAISSPATGLVVYDTDSLRLFEYNGSAWKGYKYTDEGGGSGTPTLQQVITASGDITTNSQINIINASQLKFNITDESYLSLNSAISGTTPHFLAYMTDPSLDSITYLEATNGNLTLSSGSGGMTSRIDINRYNIDIYNNDDEIYVSDGEIGILATTLLIDPPGSTGAGYVLTDVNGDGYATWQPAKRYNSTATSITLGASHCVVEVTATGQTITLPTAVGITGRFYTIKLTASGSCTVDGNASETIDGATTYSLASQYKYVTVQSNGSNWIVIGNN